MRCPSCHTENRDDRDACYHCQADLTMLRLIVNKAKHHYNRAVELVERTQYVEALEELDNALELNAKLQEAHVLRGAVLLRMERPEDAQREWEQALSLAPTSHRAHRFLLEAGKVAPALPMLRRLRAVIVGSAAVTLAAVTAGAWVAWPSAEERAMARALEAFAKPDLEGAEAALAAIPSPAANARIGESARFLRSTIRETEARAVELALAEAAFGRGDSARAALDRAESLKPTRAGREAIARAREHIAAHEAAREREAIAALSPDALRARHGALAPGLRDAFDARMLALLRDMPRASTAEAAFALAAALAKDAALLHGESARAEGLRIAGEHAAHAESLLLEETGRAVAEAPERAESVIGRALKTPGLTERGAARLQSKLAQLRASREESARAALAAALESGDGAAALAALAALEGAGGTPTAEQERAIGEVRRRHALASYYALMAHAAEIEAGRLTKAAAQEVLAQVAAARGHLPARIDAFAQDDLAFFAAAAHRSLRDAAKAESEIAALRERSPRSPWLAAWERLAAQR
jgi:Tfp pilus assembly protein PilF